MRPHERHPFGGIILKQIKNDHVIYSVCSNHNPVISSFMTYHRVSYKSNTTGATYGSDLLTIPEHMSSSTIARPIAECEHGDGSVKGMHVALSSIFTDGVVASS